MDWLEKIFTLISTREFTYSFDLYSKGLDKDTIYVQNVWEVTFINQGTSVVEINGGLKIYPVWCGLLPNTITMPVKWRERDRTVYKITAWQPVPGAIGLHNDGAGNLIQTFFATGSTFPLPKVPYDQLLVISKQLKIKQKPNGKEKIKKAS